VWEDAINTSASRWCVAEKAKVSSRVLQEHAAGAMEGPEMGKFYECSPICRRQISWHCLFTNATAQFGAFFQKPFKLKPATRQRQRQRTKGPAPQRTVGSWQIGARMCFCQPPHNVSSFGHHTHGASVFGPCAH